MRPSGQPFSKEDLPIVRASRSGETVAGEEAIMTHRDGTPVPVIASAAPLYETSGALSAVMAVSLDTSHLTELDRLKNEFLAGLRHELNTPVTSVKGFIQLAQRRLARGDDDQVRALLPRRCMALIA